MRAVIQLNAKVPNLIEESLKGIYTQEIHRQSKSLVVRQVSLLRIAELPRCTGLAEKRV
ncbi:hypothetical protein ACFLXA_02825 [Chloroflexota bacterium]